MRSLAVAVGLLAVMTAAADAKSHRKTVKREKRHSTAKPRVAHARYERVDTPRHQRIEKPRRERTNLAHAGANAPRDIAAARHPRIEIQGPILGQSVGAPWSGWLREAAELKYGDGYVIRRPWRAFGTRSTVDFVETVIGDVHDRFPDAHDIAIGDMSAQAGGQISDHSSHQSGRDVDIGFVFTAKPAGYPDHFVVGTADNLDLEATFVLVEEFAKTANQIGGAQIIFLDFGVQGLLYRWALANGEDEAYLATLFQYPHGRGQSIGIVRHEPNHADHLHVRFRCPPADTACR